MGLSSADPAVAGIWTVPLSAFTGAGTPVRRIALSAQAFLKLRNGDLYASSSARGVLLRIPIRQQAAGTPVVVRSGVVTAAVNFSNQVVRFAGDGPIRCR
ncbi:MAG TPA: hypothetical protein VGM75_04370 [Pseudonocardiaceae bacterium]